MIYFLKDIDNEYEDEDKLDYFTPTRPKKSISGRGSSVTAAVTAAANNLILYKQNPKLNIWYNSTNTNLTDSNNDEYTGILLENPSNNNYDQSENTKSFLTKTKKQSMDENGFMSNANSNTTTNTASTILTNGSYDSYENDDDVNSMLNESRENGNDRLSFENLKNYQPQNNKLILNDEEIDPNGVIQWQKSKLYLNETISLDVDDAGADDKVVGILVWDGEICIPY